MDITRLVKKEVRNLRAYSAREIPCRVKLDANESPYDFVSALQAAASIDTNRYPDPEAKKLRALLAKDLRVRPANILLGNGSDELIYYLIATFGGPVLFPSPTFSMYGIIAQALGEKALSVPLDGQFDLDLEKMLATMRKYRPKIIFLASPNNPTGNCFSADRIRKVISNAPGIVVVDEAYLPFAGKKGFLSLQRSFRNLVIMRTLSKIGLAALRVGMLVAHRQVVDEVNKVRLPFNVNALSQAVGAAALKNGREIEAAVARVVAARNIMFADLEKIPGITPCPTDANFILFRVNDPDRVYNALLKKGVLVRNFNDAVRGCLRVTVGTPRENKAFIRSLEGIQAERGSTGKETA